MRRFRHETGEGLIAGVEFGDPIRNIDAVFLHATGFNAMTYQSIMAPIGLRARVAAMDLRGHGRTTLPTKGSYASWNRHRDDVIAWLEKHAPNGTVLGGHSMGATIALLVAGKRPDLVKGLVLADPVILPPRFYFWAHMFPPVLAAMGKKNDMAARAKKRQREFDSMGAAIERYKGKGPFATWRDPFIEDYLLDGIDRIDDGATDAEDQKWGLLCDPKWEAASYGAQRNRPWGALNKVRKKKIPMVVLKAAQGSVLSDAVAQRIMRKNPLAHMKLVRGTTHFLPMEAPYAVRDELMSYISRLIEGFSALEEGPVKRSLAHLGEARRG